MALSRLAGCTYAVLAHDGAVLDLSRRDDLAGVRAALAALGSVTAVLASTAWWVPGRIEVLGKHTDYTGGRVLTCATTCGLVVVGAAPADTQSQIISGDAQVVIRDSTSAAAASDEPAIAERPPWAVYIDTVVNRLRANFPGALRGADLAVANDLPPASGMSLSSALLLGIAAALAALWKLAADPRWPHDFPGYAACIENDNNFGELSGHTGVGTAGGAMDHTAICGGQAGQLTCWSLAPTVREVDLVLPAGTSLVIAVSGVFAEKAGAARESCNAVSQRAGAALALWNQIAGRNDGTLAAAVSAGATSAQLLDADLALRLEQFIRESTVIVPTAARALAAGDLKNLAALVAESQALSVTHLPNQVPETISLVEVAIATGAHAASAFGSGFGGAVRALVNAADRQDFCAAWLAGYLQRFPLCTNAQVLHVEPGAGLHHIPCT